MVSYGGLAFIVMAIVIGTGWVVEVEFFDDGFTGDLGGDGFSISYGDLPRPSGVMGSSTA